MAIPHELILWTYLDGLLSKYVWLVEFEGFNLQVLTNVPALCEYDLCLKFQLDQVVSLLFTELGKHQTSLIEKR